MVYVKNVSSLILVIILIIVGVSHVMPKHFQENFKNWTSGNSDVDKLIQESQLNAKTLYEKLEWIEYDRFENIEYVAKGGFGTIYKAIWKDGMISRWDCETDQWKRYTYTNGV